LGKVNFSDIFCTSFCAKGYWLQPPKRGGDWACHRRVPLVPFHFTLVQNIKRDPFEQAVGIDQKTAMGLGGALGAPATAFLYDWNMPPNRPRLINQA
jgi:hypothetical protein